MHQQGQHFRSFVKKSHKNKRNNKIPKKKTKITVTERETHIDELRGKMLTLLVIKANVH